MATINIGSENASDVFYRCGCATGQWEGKREERGWREGGGRNRETSRMLVCVFFASLSSAAEEGIDQLSRSRSSLFSRVLFFFLRQSPSSSSRQVQDAAPPGQGELVLEMETEKEREREREQEESGVSFALRALPLLSLTSSSSSSTLPPLPRTTPTWAKRPSSWGTATRRTTRMPR